jgi:hypothetical protein
LLIHEGIRDPGQRAHVDAVSARGRVLLGADAAAGHDAGVGEAGARGAGDPRDRGSAMPWTRASAGGSPRASAAGSGSA